MGFYFEEPGRWHTYFGGEAGKDESDMLPGIETMERSARWNRYLGANLLFPTVMVYNGIMWPSRAADGWGIVFPENTPRMLGAGGGEVRTEARPGDPCQRQLTISKEPVRTDLR